MIRIQPVADRGLALAIIQIDGGTQSRAALNDMVVDDYADLIKAGVPFPPIVVFYDGKKHWLADGFHRVHAYQKAGKDKVDADVRQGTRRDAILFSVGANANHGLRRTNDDKRRAVQTLLNDAEWSQWSDREIARRCAVGADMVGRLRPADTVAERQYEHPKTGKPTTMKTAGINASRATAFRAANAQKSGDDDETKSCPQTLAAQGVEGDDKAEIAVSGSYPSRTEAVADADAIQIVFDRASNEGRALFLARNNLRQEAYSNAGGGDVDRSATRASSAVEVGATNSPDGATGSEPGLGHAPVCDPLAAREADESAATHSNSSEPSSSQALTDSPVLTSSPASGTPFRTLSPADRINALRPNCLRPELCAGSGRQHCYSCRKAAGDEGEAA